MKETYWSAAYNRLKLRMGAKRAIIAIGRKILVAIYYMLKNKTAYAELGAGYVDSKMHAKRANYYQRQLQNLGFDVTLLANAEMGHR